MNISSEAEEPSVVIHSRNGVSDHAFYFSKSRKTADFIHFNAGGGQGFEMYHSVVGGTSKKLAENINAATSNLMKSRGIKTLLDNGKDSFRVIRDT